MIEVGIVGALPAPAVAPGEHHHQHEHRDDDQQHQPGGDQDQIALLDGDVAGRVEDHHVAAGEGGGEQRNRDQAWQALEG